MVSRGPPTLDGLPILVVSANPGTSSGMRSYLAGVGARATTAPSPDAIAPGPRALVVFADDFPAHEVAAVLRRLAAGGDDPIVVLVSADPEVASLLGADADAAHVVRIPRPAWSWSVLEAIRGRLSPAGALERESP